MKLKILAVLALLIMPLAGIAEVIEWSDGTVLEGPIVDGKKNGHWVIKSPFGGSVDLQGGGVSEGPYVDGKKNGYWVIKEPDGKVKEVRYRYGHLIE